MFYLKVFLVETVTFTLLKRRLTEKETLKMSVPGLKEPLFIYVKYNL